MRKQHQVKTSPPKFEEEKFRELIIYIADKCENHTLFGSVKLNKVLFYSDFLAYKVWGKPITGADYLALERGPGPRALVPIRQDMIRKRDIAPDNRMFQNRLVPLRDAKLSLFSAQEIALVDKVIHILKNENAEAVSELSHAFLGWKAAWAESTATGKKISIPYGTVFVESPPLDEFEAAHGLDLAGKYGWAV